MNVATSPRRSASVIGLGSIGLGMARSLMRAGFRVTGCDVSPAGVERLVAEDGRLAPTPRTASGGTMVPNRGIGDTGRPRAAVKAVHGGQRFPAAEEPAWSLGSMLERFMVRRRLRRRPDLEEGDPDWLTRCRVCDGRPTVHPTGWCGPCCWGNSPPVDGNW